MQCYKVVEQSTSDPAAFRSVMPRCRPWRLDYRIGEWAEPDVPGTKLFAFRSLSAARRFCQTVPYRGAIFECEVRGDPKRPRRIVDPLAAKMRSFWKHIIDGFVPDGCSNPPQGTVWVDAVKLGQRIE